MVLKAKIFKGKYEPKLAFPEGWGVQTNKTLRGRRMNVFWNNTIKATLSEQACFLHMSEHECVLLVAMQLRVLSPKNARFL